MIGPGKYDDWVTKIREAHGSTGVILIVADGDRGQGFSAQMTRELAAKIPAVLRQVASEIESSLATGQQTN